MNKEIAKWLYDNIMTNSDVYQSDAVREIAEKFGKEYTYIGESGNLRINTAVLAEFEKIKDKDIIEWNPGDKLWSKNTNLENELGLPNSIEVPELVDMPKIELESFEPLDNDFELK